MQRKGTPRRRLPEGVIIRHSKLCATAQDGKCNCEPSFRASAYDKRERKKVYATFSGQDALEAARLWRATKVIERKQRRIGPSSKSLNEAAAEFFRGAKLDPPTVLTKSGTPYKPSVLRGWERDLDAYVLNDLGSYRLSEIELDDFQQLVHRLAAKGLSPSRVRNILNPVRAIYRRAVKFERLQVNPTTGLEFAAMPDLVKRAAEPTDLHDLLGALAEAYGTSRHGRELDDRARWATAAYAGLRLGELRALRWSDVELRSGEGAHAGWISVTRSWDNVAGAVLPKSKAGKRRVPIVSPYLADELQALRERTERSGDDFVFGQTAAKPFYTNVEQRMKNALARVNKERAKRKLDPVAYFGLHAMRHTFGALCRAAGIPEADTSEYLGHSRQGVTARYTSAVDVDAAALDNMQKLAAFIARGDTEARLAQLDAELEPVRVPLLAEQVRQAFANDSEGFERFLIQFREDGGVDA